MLQVDAIVYLVDAADRERFPESQRELAGLLSDDGLAGVPFLVLGNKIDLPYAGGCAGCPTSAPGSCASGHVLHAQLLWRAAAKFSSIKAQGCFWRVAAKFSSVEAQCFLSRWLRCAGCMWVAVWQWWSWSAAACRGQAH